MLFKDLVYNHFICCIQYPRITRQASYTQFNLHKLNIFHGQQKRKTLSGTGFVISAEFFIEIFNYHSKTKEYCSQSKYQNSVSYGDSIQTLLLIKRTKPMILVCKVTSVRYRSRQSTYQEGGGRCSCVHCQKLARAFLSLLLQFHLIIYMDKIFSVGILVDRRPVRLLPSHILR